jgi:tripartite ATP-independent transporter DctP family solute receptor
MMPRDPRVARAGRGRDRVNNVRPASRWLLPHRTQAPQQAPSPEEWMMAKSARLVGMGMAALLALTGAGFAAPAWSQEMTLGNVNPPKHGTSQAAQHFVDKVAELSGGKIKIAHHHSGAMGGEREVAQQIQLGAVDFGPITAAPLSTLIPEMSVFQLPYIFRDYDHLFKALDSSDTLTKYYAGVLDKKGLKLIGFIAAGYRGIYGHYPVNSIDDIKGKKIRVQEDKILVATFKALGAISTPIAFPEVATALQTKVIDFGEGGINTYYHNKFYDIVKNVADVRHTHQAIVLIMSKASWGKLDAAGQKAVMDAWASTREFNRKFILEEDKSIQDLVRAKGGIITKPDAAPFRAATKSVYDEFLATDAGKDAAPMVDYILSIK